MEIKVSPREGVGEITYKLPDVLARILEKNADPQLQEFHELLCEVVMVKKMIAHALEGIILGVNLCMNAPRPVNAILMPIFFEELDGATARVMKLAILMCESAGFPNVDANNIDFKSSFGIPEAFRSAFEGQNLDPS